MILLEDNENIDSLVDHINKLIVDLRKKKNFKKKLLNEIKNTYDNIILDWLENNYIKNIDLNKQREDKLINELLDFINLLEKLK